MHQRMPQIKHPSLLALVVLRDEVRAVPVRVEQTQTRSGGERDGRREGEGVGQVDVGGRTGGERSGRTGKERLKLGWEGG
jgi:hypothetical protein